MNEMVEQFKDMSAQGLLEIPRIEATEKNGGQEIA